MNIKINKKIGLGITIILVVIGIIITIIITNENKKLAPGNEYFSEKSSDWIEDDVYSDDIKDISINTRKATRNQGHFQDDKLELFYSGKRLTFFYHGFYKGNSFNNVYLSLEQRESLNTLTDEMAEKFVQKNAIMKISPNMNPDDGIIDSYILGKVEDSQYVFYIFVDEDWKNNLEYTNILWTDDFNSNEINVIPFDFSDSTQGIYVNKIKGPSWFEENTNGGIYLGEISIDLLKITDATKLNNTFIYIR